MAKKTIHPNSIKAAKANKHPNWKKGDPSPNPSGHPKGQKNRSTILKELLGLTLTQNGKALENPLDPTQKKMTIETGINIALIQKALKGNIEAIKEIQDTVHGKITENQNIQLESFNHNAEMTAEELKEELENRGLPTEIFQK